MATPFSILDERPPVEFRIGDALLKSWNVLTRHFPIFAALSAAALVPQLLLSLRIIRLGPLSNGLYAIVVQLTFTTLAQAIVIYAAFQDLRGRRVGVVDSMARGLARFLPAIAVALLSAVIVVIALMILVIPGLIATAALAVAIPVCVVERAGPITSLSRSADLTRGFWWHIIGVSVGLYVVGFLVGRIIVMAVPGQPTVMASLVWLFQVAATSFQSVFAAILYHDLRAFKEGIGIDEIAAVFD